MTARFVGKESVTVLDDVYSWAAEVAPAEGGHEPEKKRFNKRDGSIKDKAKLANT